MKFSIKTAVFCLMSFFVACQNSSDPQQETTEIETAEMTQTQSPNTLSEEEETYGWELLFDGKSTELWNGYNKTSFPTKGWSVEDEMLIVKKSGTEEDGFGGDIVTKDKYENFELTIDFMLSDTANSGIFYMVTEEEGSAIWHNAPEYQILDDATYATMGVTNIHFTAANYDLHPAEKDYKNPMGEWNTARIIVNKGHVEHWLNGNKVVEYDLWTPEWEAKVKASKFKDYPGYGRTKNGQIGLQDHGHEVKFRNLKIRSI
jgi:alpha-3'-ketoglucosidase